MGALAPLLSQARMVWRNLRCMVTIGLRVASTRTSASSGLSLPTFSTRVGKSLLEYVDVLRHGELDREPFLHYANNPAFRPRLCADGADRWTDRCRGCCAGGGQIDDEAIMLGVADVELRLWVARLVPLVVTAVRGSPDVP